MKFILGKKLGMSQVFDKEGNTIPVTVIEAGPCVVIQIKTKEPHKASSEPRGKKDGYDAIQIGCEKLKPKKVKKSQRQKPFRYLREFRGDISKYKVGDKINVSIFSEGDVVRISGTSKGKGFQGVVKRHGFSGGPASHGHRHVLRTPGSIGGAFPQRVLKGMKMAGHAGAERVTVKRLKVVKVDKENNLLAVKGAVPGARGGLVEVRSGR